MLEIREVYKNYKKSLQIFLLIISVIFAIYFVVPSTLSYRTGNVFFGGVPKLYNVNLAHFFFKLAAYPQFGEPVPYSHHQLSRTYFIQGKLDDALEEAKIELITYPESLSTYYILGLTYGYMNREEEAIAAFSKYIENYPNNWAPRNDKAWLQFRIGDVEGARATVEPVATDTYNPWIQNTYGAILLNLGENEKAIIAFNNAKIAVENMSVEEWGMAYPGNDPRIYDIGLSAMKKSIESNLQKANEG